MACAPLEPCLLVILDPPLAAFAAVLALLAFFADSAADFFSLPDAMAALRAASRASGRCVRRSLITSSEAPTMARWLLTVRRERFLATSCSSAAVSFLFLLLSFPSAPGLRLRSAAYLGDTLLVLSAEEDGPCDAAGVLALEEQGLGLALLETEDLAVATDVDLTL